MAAALTTTPIAHADLNTKVYEHLRAAVLSGALQGGQKLNLNTLSEELGVSRSPVHQALTRLAAEGLVDVRSRRGYEVTPIGADRVVDEYDVRMALELLAAERAVGTLDATQAAAFGEALAATLEATHDGVIDLAEYIATNQEFHRLQLDLAGNRALSSVYGNLRVSLLMERVLAGVRLDRETSAELNEQHVELHRAYVAGDLAAAQRTIRAHCETGRRLAVDAIERAGGAR
jgi:GntR family transcriptional regulator, rspAB operon transcriptional repressor